MKYSFFAISMFFTSFLISCGSDKEEKDASLAPPSTIIPTQKINAPDSSLLKPTNIPANNITVTPATNTVNINPQNSVVTTMPATAVQSTSAVNNGNLNPPHGQPGHRCDLAVGAPLNSKPAQPAAVTATPNQPQAKINSQPVVQTVAPGMNPPHGQPGHRCDISVGAPLNSKPTVPAAVTPAIVNPTITAPVKPDSIKN